MPKIAFEYKITFGNLVQIGVIIGGFIVAWFALVGSTNANTTAIVELQKAIAPIETFNTRLTVVESRAETQSRETAKIVQAVEDLVAAINQDRLVSTRNDAEIRKDVGYLREWVEEQKRAAR